MPQIPELGNDQISKAVPTANVGYTDPTGGVLESLGGQVANFGMKLVEMQKKSDDESYVFNKKNNLLRDYTTFTNDLKLKSPADGAGYTSATQNWLNDRLSADLKDAPSTDAQNLYNKDFQGFQTHSGIDSQEYEKTKAANFAVSSIGDQANTNARFLVSNPDDRLALEQIKALNQQNKSNIGVHYDEASAKKVFDSGSSTMAKAYFDGLSAHEAYKFGLDKLNASEDESSIAKYLTPAQKETLVSEFKAKQEAKDGVSSGEVQHGFMEASAMAKAGIMPDKKTIDALTMKMNSIPDSHLKQYQRDEMLSDLKTSILVGSKIKETYYVPENKWTDPKTLLPKSGDLIGAADKIAASKSLEAAQNNARDDIKKDPIGYFVSGNPSLKSLQSAAADKMGNPQASIQFIKKMDIVQDKNEVPAQSKRVLSNQDTQYWGSLFNNAKTGEVTGRVMTGMQNATGPYFNKAFSELVASPGGEKYKDLLPISFVADPMNKQYLADNVTNKVAIRDGYVNKNLTPDKILQRVSEKTSDLGNSFAFGDNTGRTGLTAKAFRDNITTEVMKNFQGNTNVSDGDMEKAIDQATKNIAGKQFIQIKAGRLSDFSMPATYVTGDPARPVLPNRPAAIGAFVSVYSKPENLKELDVQVPINSNYEAVQTASINTKERSAEAVRMDQMSGLSQIGKDVFVTNVNKMPDYVGKTADQIKQETQDRYLKFLSQNGQWGTNTAQDGLALKYRDHNLNRWVDVVDSKGNPIEKKFIDINQNPGQKVLDRANTSWKFGY